MDHNVQKHEGLPALDSHLPKQVKSFSVTYLKSLISLLGSLNLCLTASCNPQQVLPPNNLLLYPFMILIMKLTFTLMSIALTASFHLSSQHHVFTKDPKQNLRATESKSDLFYFCNPHTFLAILLPAIHHAETSISYLQAFFQMSLIQYDSLILYWSWFFLEANEYMKKGRQLQREC